MAPRMFPSSPNLNTPNLALHRYPAPLHDAHTALQVICMPPFTAPARQKLQSTSMSASNSCARACIRIACALSTAPSRETLRSVLLFVVWGEIGSVRVGGNVFVWDSEFESGSGQKYWIREGKFGSLGWWNPSVNSSTFNG